MGNWIQNVQWLAQGHTTDLWQRSSGTKDSSLSVQVSLQYQALSFLGSDKSCRFTSLQPPNFPAQYYVWSQCSINEKKMEGASGIRKGKEEAKNKECAANLAKLSKPRRPQAGWAAGTHCPHWHSPEKRREGQHLDRTCRPQQHQVPASRLPPPSTQHCGTLVNLQLTVWLVTQNWSCCPRHHL